MENPADLLTRGVTSRNLKESDLWWKGPSWLSSAEETWPNQKLNQASTRDAQKERKAKPVQNFVTVSEIRQLSTMGIMNDGSS